MTIPMGPGLPTYIPIPWRLFPVILLPVNMASKSNSKTDKGFKVIYFSYATYC